MKHKDICLLSLFAVMVLTFSPILYSGPQEDDILIPPEAHVKAIKALRILGPERGAKKIDFRMVRILGLEARSLEGGSEKIKAALNDLGAKETETEYQIELSGDVLFDFDKWNIKDEALETLKKVGEVVFAVQSPEVVIEGHTDSKGTEEYNQELSEKRAQAVKEWLISNMALDKNIFKVIGHGESKPAAPNINPDGTDNPEGRQKNRRVAIIVKKKQE
jgi:outer membrane protein OmpA-like peptidoglycan-associated protein